MKLIDTGTPLRLLHIPMPNAKSTVVLHSVLAGSAKEATPETYGYSHFAEHMAFKGTKSRTWMELLTDASMLGANINAWTSRMTVEYYLEFPPEHLKKGLHHMEDCVFQSTFPQDEMDKEKLVIIEEMKSYEDDHMSAFFETMEGLNYREDLGHKILVTRESVMAATTETCLGFVHKNYSPNNMLLTICGPATEEEVLEAFDGAREKMDFPCMDEISYPSGDPFDGEPTIDYFGRAGIQQSYVGMLMPGVPFDDDLSAAASVLLSILGGGFHSVMWCRLREELGLCYTVRAGKEPEISYPGAGIAYSYAMTDPARAREAEDEMLKCIADVRQGDYSDNTFECSKQLLVGKRAMAFNSPMNVAMAMANSWIYGVETDLDSQMAEIRSVTRADVAEAAERILRPEGIRVCAMSPE
jgi:predicted Zn-dependent peptidase